MKRAHETAQALGVEVEGAHRGGPLCLCSACLRERERVRSEMAAPYAPTPFTGRDCPSCHWNERAPAQSTCRVCHEPMTLEGLQAENDAARARIDRELDAPRRRR